MRIMEKDAEERHARRKKNEKLAMAQKDLGNEEFSKGNYEKAVEFYSEVRMKERIEIWIVLINVYLYMFQALSLFKDTTVLWTNRAQAYIKLGEYEKALHDCDWATRVRKH